MSLPSCPARMGVRIAALTAVVAVVGLAFAPCVLEAQVAGAGEGAAHGTGRVVGIVFDSLMMRPLAGASVWTADGLHGALSDSAGRFTMDSVAPGPRLVLAGHPAADSIGVYTLRAMVQVEAGANAAVTLAVPSYAAVAATMCPAATVASWDRGILFGTVRDAATDRPLAGAVATLTWLSLNDAARRSVDGPAEVLSARMDVTTDSSGAYFACGIPAMGDVMVQAVAGTADSAASGVVSIALPERRLLRRDLLVADASAEGQEVVVVTVRAGERPLAGARVAVPGGEPAVTSAAGMAVLRSVQAGTRMVSAAAIGYPPTQSPVDIVAGDTARIVLNISRAWSLLDTLIVRRSRALGEVEQRRRMGLGYSMMGEELAKRHTLRSVFDEFPSVFTAGRGSIDFSIMMPAPFPHVRDTESKYCAAHVFVDGRLTGMDYATSYKPEELLAVEVFPRVSMVPIQYKRFAGYGEDCGVVLVWTRR